MSEEFDRGQQIGEILANVKALDERLGAHIADESAEVRRTVEAIAAVQASVTSIEQKLNTVRFLWMFVKACAATVVLLLTFKVGDVSAVWKNLVK